jgi:hypothetical protein
MTTMIKKPETFNVHGAIQSGADLMQWRRHLGINRPVYATLSACSERTLASEEARHRLNLQKARKLNESHRLLMGLCEIMVPANVGQWLNEPNEWFGGKTPLEVIRSGQMDQVWELIHHTREGGYA